jgi:tRNA pseudouridine38-40 synthase
VTGIAKAVPVAFPAKLAQRNMTFSQAIETTEAVVQRRTVRLAVEYDGTSFCGLQFQPELRSVAGVLEKALSRVFEEPIKLAAAGRTDAGVHASGQVVSFTTTRSTFPFERLTRALNSALPGDLSVREAAVVEAEFSARFSAIERTYVYAILNRSEPSALLARYAAHVWAPIDVDRFADASRHFIGTHDFRSFCATLPENGITVRTIHAFTVQQRCGLIRIQVTGDGFLHKMVRTIVGTLIQCGTGRRDPESIPAVIAARDRKSAGLTAVPHGLYLAGVVYRGGYDSYAEPPIFQSGEP